MGTISKNIKKEIVETWEDTKPTSPIVSEESERLEGFIKALDVEDKEETWNPIK